MTPAELSDVLVAALRESVADGELAVGIPDEVEVTRPRSREHGDYASNIALRLAKAAGRPPREVAQGLATRLLAHPAVAAVDVAGPGFVNITLEAAAQGETARTVLAAGAGYGRSEVLAGQRVNLEFVSANPTGPLHIGHVRWAAVGDALGRLLAAGGAAVTKEYYLNDAGVQVDRFAASLEAAARGDEVPADGYGGAYVGEMADQVLDAHPGLLEEPAEKASAVFRREGLRVVVEEIEASLRRFGVSFDVFTSEQGLHDSGEVAEAVQRLRAEGHVEERDGAVWLRTTDFGDDKDRVLVKTDGETTYFAADCAYYLDKRRRGFDRCVLMLGADHHGYLGRMRAMVACFGDDPAQTLELLIGQLVTVLRDGQPVRMSKRAGTVLTLDELVEMTGADAARYTLARSSSDSTLELDVDLVTRQTSDNPVFYVQYVAARTAGIAREAPAHGIGYDLATVDVGLLQHPREGELLGALAEFPAVVATAAELRAPHRVARYLEETVAPSFHRFYDACRVVPYAEERPGPVNDARLLLVDATRTVVVNALDLLGVSAPERM